MATENTKILTAEQEQQLRQPIDEYVGGIQAKIDALRKDGTDQVVEIQSSMDSLKRDRIYTQQEKEAKLAQYKAELEKAKAVESQNKAEVDKLIAEAESYLNSHFGEYYQAVVESGKAEVLLRSGSDDPEILLSGSGEYTGTWEVDGESTYIGVRCEDAVGELFIQIE